MYQDDEDCVQTLIVPGCDDDTREARIVMTHPIYFTELAGTVVAPLAQEKAVALDSNTISKDHQYFRATKDRLTFYCKSQGAKAHVAALKKYWAVPWATLSNDCKKDRVQKFRRNTRVPHTPEQKSLLVEYSV